MERRRDDGGVDDEFTRAAGSPLSVYQAVRRHDPGLPTIRVRKPTVTALTHALEDEIADRCERPVLFGGFQQVRHLTLPLPRWQELARSARAAIVFVEDPAAGAPPSAAGVRVLALPPDAPMRWEWAVVAADPAFGVVLSAWEIPGAHPTRDRDRVFELAWSLEPGPVHAAARACARVAAQAGFAEAEELLPAAPGPDIDVRTAGEVFTRVLRRVDEVCGN